LSGISLGWTDSASEREARVDVIRSAWRAAYAHIFTHGDIEGEGSWVASRLAPAGTLAARRDGRLIGLASLGLLRNGDAELAAFYVRPEEQRRGVGLALWSLALDEFQLRGCTRMEVWTLARAGARQFYEARGCVAFGVGSFTAAGHVEPAVGYAVRISGSSSSPPA
jgi:GNAT superfamily N-acetyltransferase